MDIEIENSQHYFFDCLNYAEIRRNLQNSLPSNASFDLDTLLQGDRTLSDDENVEIFSAVHKFITDSLRFI